MKKSKYTSEDKTYALGVVAQLGGSYEKAAAYLKEEGRIVVAGKTIKNWNNELPMVVAEAMQEVLPATITQTSGLSLSEIKVEAAKGLGAVVSRINERLAQDKFSNRLNSYELVNIGNFFASLSGITNEDKPQGSTTNIYQQIINQSYSNE